MWGPPVSLRGAARWGSRLLGRAGPVGPRQKARGCGEKHRVHEQTSRLGQQAKRAAEEGGSAGLPRRAGHEGWAEKEEERGGKRKRF
jgi:hypothetical protein